MKTQNIISLYFALSVCNGIVPISIALLFSASIWGVLAIWALSTAITFSLICLVCLRSALEETRPQVKERNFRGEIEGAFS